MRRGLLVAATLVVVGVAFALTRAQAPGGASGRNPQEEQAIRKAGEAYTIAFNKGDLDAVLALWAPDADYVDETGKVYSGRNALAALFKSTLANLKGSKLKFQVNAVRFLKPDVAIEDGTAEITQPDGTVEKSRYTAVWTKTGDKWLISSARELASEGDDQPAAPAVDRLKQLAWLIGEWATDDKEATVHLNCRWALDQHFLSMEYTVKGKEGQEMTVEQRIGWDAERQQIRSWVFDSRGGHGQGLWRREGNVWHASATGVLPDGRVGSATNSLRFVDDNAFVWRSTDRSVDGQPMPDTEVKFARKSAEGAEK